MTLSFRSTRTCLLALSVVLSTSMPTAAFANPSVLRPSRRSLVVTPSFVLISRTPPEEGAVNGASKDESALDSRLFSFSGLRKLSNFASLLCVLDCTLLPIVTVGLPLLGIMKFGPAQMEFFHHLGHQIALFFVLPVGTLTTTVNFISHKRKRIAALAAIGLLCVGLANSHIHSLPLLGHAHWLHTIQHGPLHRIVNVMGCAMLLGSNYWSQKQPGCAHGPECGSHSHSHEHHTHM